MGHTRVASDRFLETLQDYVTLQRVAAEFGLRMRGYRRQGRVSVVDTDEGAKEIRRLHHSPDEFRFACAAADYLRGQGFSRLPRATWAPNGSPFVELDGVLYTMRDWVHGNQVDLDNICQLTQAVEMLAWFHRCAAGFRPAIAPHVRDEWGSWPRRFAERIEEFYRFEEAAKAAAEEDRFARLFLKVFEDFLREAAKALEELETGPYQQNILAEKELGGLCHRDYTARNIVLRDDGSLYLTDFDDIAMDSRLEDLGRFLARHGHWEVERSVFILQVYHGVNRLARADVDCLLAYLRYPWEFWSAVNAHFTGKESDRRLLRHLASTLPARQGYLEKLSGMDWSFLAGGSPVYSAGFVNLPEVPSGKAWTDGFQPAADPFPAELDWTWQAPAQEEPPGDYPEPSREGEWSGMVLEETGGGVGDSWPGNPYGPMPATACEEPGEDNPPDRQDLGAEPPLTAAEGEDEERAAECSPPAVGPDAAWEAGAEQAEPRHAPPAGTGPEGVEESEGTAIPAEEAIPIPEAAPAAVLRWRPFPAPLGGRGKGGARHGG